MLKMNHAFVSFLCIFFSNHSYSQVNFSDTAKLKKSLERFVQLKLNNENFPEDDTAKIYGVKDNEYWETDEKGALKIHNNHDESIAYKSDPPAINFHRLQMKEIGLAYSWKILTYHEKQNMQFICTK